MAGQVRLDKVRSVYNGHIESVKHATADKKIENGMVGVAGDLVAGEREIRALTAPTDTKDKLVLIANDEINYKDGSQVDRAMSAFTGLTADEGASRAYHLESGDIFSVSKDMVVATATVEKGKYVVAKAGDLKLEAIESLTPETEYGFVGKIEAIEAIGTAIVVGQAGSIGRSNEWVVVTVVQN